MIILLSPSKTMSKREAPDVSASIPLNVERAEQLVESLRKLGPRQLPKMLGVSNDIAELNRKRFDEWTVAKHSSGKPAIYAYAGDTYNGLAAFDMSDTVLARAQHKLIILSGLYGGLRPLDAIMPYRLEMSTRLNGKWGKNLYDFWGSGIYEQIQSQADGFIRKALPERFNLT